MPDMAVRTAFTATDKVSPAFKRMESGARSFGRTGSGVFKKVGSAASGLRSLLGPVMAMFSVYAVKQFGDQSIQAWNQQAAAIANVNAGLTSTNNAIGLTSQELQKMASISQSQTFFGDESILQNATAQLLTFGNIGKQNFDRVQRAALDVTAKLKGLKATGEDIRSTSIMMGKAMDDPIRGMGAMRRIGISFSAAEEQIIKSMVAHNDVAGAQAAMLKIIERQYGGTAAALAQTDAGKAIQDQNRIGDSMERVGKALIPLQAAYLRLKAAAVEAIAGIADRVSAWYDKNKQVIDQKLNSFIDNVTAAFQVLNPYIQLAFKIFFGLAKIGLTLISWIKPLAPFLIGIAVAWGAWQAITLIQTAQLWAATAAQWAMNAAMTANPIGLVIVGVGLLIGAFILLGKIVVQNWDKISAAISSFAGMAMSVLTKVWEGIKFGFQAAFGFVKTVLFTFADYFLTIWGNIIKGVLGAASKIGGMLGINTSGLDSVIGKVNTLQQSVRAQSAFGGGAQSPATAPNNAEVQARYAGNNTQVNVYGQQPGTRAEVTPRRGATVNMQMVGANP